MQAYMLKVKSGARALDKKIEHQNRDTNSKYEEKKTKEKALQY